MLRHSPLAGGQASACRAIRRHDGKGFFTDTTLCIGCKACEVACKQWNQLPGDDYEFTGMSYDNTAALGATTWRHVAFIEQFDRGHGQIMAHGTTARRPSPATGCAAMRGRTLASSARIAG